VQLTKTVELSPDLQILFNPAANRGTDAAVVPGGRFTMVF
jgi:carbohydrate-selective porin OprB